MGRSLQDRTGRSKRRASAPDGRETGSLLPTLTAGLIGAALTARLLVPTESAADGDTLWLVQLWLGAGLLWAWNCFRQRDTKVRWDAADAAVGLLVAGHIISALLIVAGEGDKRAALNMLWEWVGLGVGWFLIRQTVRTAKGARALTAVMIVLAAVMSGVGLWQHYVFYPQAGREYSELRGELDRELQRGNPDPSQTRELRRKLRNLGVPPDAVDGPARMAFEQRLQSSSEPFGAFALANTFAGWLAVWLFPAVAALPIVYRRFGVSVRSAAVAACPALILYCLLLTKSRTAWAGVVAGSVTWMVLAFRRRERWRRTIVVGTVAATVVAAVLLIVGVFTRGLDFEVVSEAPKSLSYRLQYWTASWQVVRQHPWWGVGPGNFRQHYLEHKLPESSEEIVDPHNFVLDLWASGGVLALAGMLWLLALFAKHALMGTTVLDETSEPADGDTSTIPFPLVIGAACSFWLVLGYGAVLADGVNFQVLIVFAAWAVGWLMLGPTMASLRLPAECLIAAVAALLVHLLGAGGIEMPAVVQTLLLLLILFGLLGGEVRSAEVIPERRRLALVIGGLMPVLFVTCLLTATGPVLHRRALVDAAEAIWLERGDFPRSATLLAEAAERDPLSPDPLRRLAQLNFARWHSSPTASNDELNRAFELGKFAIEKDPHSAVGYRMLGEWQLAAHRRTGDSNYADQAARSFTAAVERYPHNAALRAELAEALFRAGDVAAARTQAERAEWLDAVNRRAGHIDKYLPPETTAFLRRVGEAGAGSPDDEIRD